MAFIVITSDVDFIYVEFNDASAEWNRVKLKRTQARSVCKMIDNKGVEVIWSDSKNFVLKHEYVDSIDGVEITDNDLLYSKLCDLMK
jgi:hypothetical protein